MPSPLTSIVEGGAHHSGGVGHDELVGDLGARLAGTEVEEGLLSEDLLHTLNSSGVGTAAEGVKTS